jgi:hypothetical protein
VKKGKNNGKKRRKEKGWKEGREDRVLGKLLMYHL